MAKSNHTENGELVSDDLINFFIKYLNMCSIDDLRKLPVDINKCIRYVKHKKELNSIIEGED